MIFLLVMAMYDLPTICTFPQYHYCGNRECSLAHKCSNMPYLRTNTLCKRHLKVNIKNRSYRDKLEHHRRYEFYNYFFGDSKEKQKRYRAENGERLKKRKLFNFSEPYKLQKYFCDLNCDNCVHDDCILPEWNNHKEYTNLWIKANKERFSEINKKSYYKHREERLIKQKEYFSKPDVKQRRYEYDKKYRETHREQEREKYRRYYERHKEEINQKKREKRKGL